MSSMLNSELSCSEDNILLSFIGIIPPTSNNQYKPIIKKRAKNYFFSPMAKTVGPKLSFAATDKLKAFQKEMALYPFQYPNHFAHCKKKVDQWMNEKKLLDIHCTFFLNESRIYTKDLRPQVWDVSNRLKALHDCVAKMLDIDDKLFFRIAAEKAIAHQDIEEMTCVQIMPYT